MLLCRASVCCDNQRGLSSELTKWHISSSAELEVQLEILGAIAPLTACRTVRIRADSPFDREWLERNTIAVHLDLTFGVQGLDFEIY